VAVGRDEAHAVAGPLEEAAVDVGASLVAGDGEVRAGDEQRELRWGIHRTHYS